MTTPGLNLLIYRNRIASAARSLGMTCAVDADVNIPAIVLHEPRLSAAVSTVVFHRATAFAAGLEDTARDACDAGRPDFRLSIWTQCETAYASPTLVSVACEGYVNAGGAHPIKSVLTMTYELPAVREVRLEEFFAPRSGWRAAIDRFSASAFEREIGGDPTDPSWPATTSPNAFAVTTQGLRFYFEEDVPFVVGSVHPVVSWTELRPYLRRGGVVVHLPGP
jgi:hypothetical protein